MRSVNNNVLDTISAAATVIASVGTQASVQVWKCKYAVRGEIVNLAQVIANSISLLNPSDVIKLLDSLISIIQSRGSSGGNKTVTRILSRQPIFF